MKTLFGMTAAVLLVVSMLVVSLPGTGLAAEMQKADRAGKPPKTTRAAYPDINGSPCSPNGTTYSPAGGYCKQNTPTSVFFDVFICENGKWKKRNGWFDGGREYKCPDDKECSNGTCVCPNKVMAAGVMAGAQKSCGCTSCTECEECVKEKCKPIQNASPSNPKCLKK